MVFVVFLARYDYFIFVALINAYHYLLKYASEELISFSLMFSFVFVAFLCLFYLLFLSHISSCSTMLKTAQMLFEMALLKFDSSQLIEASPFVGSFCFSLFIFLVVFVCLSMFITIIIKNIRRARDNVKNDDEQIFSFMLQKFRHWIALKKATKEEIHEERGAMMREQHLDPIKNFPEKIDQFLNALNRVLHFL
jgi:hypothetical protein